MSFKYSRQHFQQNRVPQGQLNLPEFTGQALLVNAAHLIQ
jgi:hypothetical protein